jgi:asparagine synthase (glutamine-hydrolysing)
MCGIAGFINDKNISKDYIDSVTKQLSRRGPDYQESWLDKKRNFCFIHTRLSILDVSKNGNQPMRSQSGNILITFNGEIYNHLEIRHKIEKQKNGYNWRSSSDTETVVEAIDIYGLDETLKILDGMFAFCIYDYKKNVFFLARDKFGEKPLYYGFEKEVFLFGSDLSILKEHKSFKKELDYTAIDFFLKLSYIPAPLTIFKNFHKLNSGCYLEILYPKMTTNIVSYWSIEKNSKKIITNEITSQQKLVDNCNEILKKSVISRTLSDVPIGTFLSSGIDSSLITSLVKSHTNKSLDTFTLGYDDKYDDETKHAQLIAKQIGTNHNELKVSYDDILQTIEEIPNTYSEPFADSSQIPTMLISKFAKAKVSVVLTGDGGDEIFGGYNRHVWLSKLSKLSKVNKKIFLFFFNILNNFKLFGYKNESLKLKINKLIQILKLDNIQQMYLLTIFHDHDTNLMNDKLIKTHDFFN